MNNISNRLLMILLILIMCFIINFDQAVDGVIAKIALKEGATQREAGAGEGELWLDLSDNTLKIGRPLITSYQPVKVANPASRQFPQNTVRDSYSRSVWDMQYYNGRIYVGSGDIARNIEPGVAPASIHVWSVDNRGNVKDEIDTQTEAVYRIRVYGDALMVLSFDNIGYDVGNIITKTGSVWNMKRGAIPYQNKGVDSAILNGDIYVIRDKRPGVRERKYRHAFMKTSNMGATWQIIIGNLYAKGLFFRGFVPLDNSILIFGSEELISKLFVYRAAAGLAATGIADPVLASPLPLAPTRLYSYDKAYQATRYKDGALYSPVVKNEYWRYTGLFRVDMAARKAFSIAFFQDKMVRDWIVRDDMVYALTAAPEGDFKATDCQWMASLYSSSDLEKWDKEWTVTLPGLPYSLEELDGMFYLGLGARTKGRYFGGPFSDKESGSIYKIMPKK